MSTIYIVRHGQSLGNLRGGHFREGAEIGVAEGAGTVAAREAEEYGRSARIIALALEGIENLVDSV